MGISEKVYGHSLNSNQRQVLTYLMEQFEVQKTNFIKIPISEGKKVESSWLRNILDIRVGYTDDDFIRNLCTVQIGFVWSQYNLSREICNDENYINYLIKQEEDGVIKEFMNDPAMIITLNFRHITYDSIREIITVTSFFKKIK